MRADLPDLGFPLNPIEQATFEHADVRSLLDVASLLQAFPSIGTIGVRVPYLSNAVARTLGASALKAGGMANRPRIAQSGAVHPPAARWGLKQVVSSIPATQAVVAAPTGSIDLRRQHWQVRDQNPRGTCVAFATAACVEFQKSIPPASLNDLSEQFLYWAIKTKTADPNPTDDGTFLSCARDAVQGYGICTEAFWPYDVTVIPGNPGHDGFGDPTLHATADALTRMLACRDYDLFQAGSTGAVTHVLNALLRNRPVALTVPVFQGDGAVASNWETTIAWDYGKILNPPKTAAVISGHAVCVTGFVPDNIEPNGGYFIFRNSWSSAWSNKSPSNNSFAPEQGYGQISATYVENYAWEMLQF